MKKFIFTLLILSACAPGPVTPVVPPVITPPSVQIGTQELPGTVYSWSPIQNLDNASIAQPVASPSKSTTYTVTATTQCGVTKSSVIVHVYKLLANGSLQEVK